MTRTSRHEAGFTLIEALVAFVVLSLCLAAFYQAMGGAYRGVAIAKLRAEALELARSQIEEIGVTTALNDGVSTGRFRPGLTWRITISPLGGQAAGSVYQSRPHWVVQETLDEKGAVLVRLQTVKLSQDP